MLYCCLQSDSCINVAAAEHMWHTVLQTNKQTSDGLRFIVVWLISANRSVKKLFESVLYTNIDKCFGVTGWKFDDKNVRSVLVKLTVEDRDKFCFDIKQ